MAEIVRMPKLSDTMTDGVVAAWHKKVGDKVASGDLLADIETDKATMEFESFYDGVLLHIGVEKGKSAPVNEILAIIGEEGTDISALLKSGSSEQKSTANEEIKPKESSAQTKPAAQQVDLSQFKAEVVRMPKLSDTMTDGVVAAWHKKVGDQVSSGDLLAEIETDKATMEFESFYDGLLLHIGVEQGSSAPVNSILAIIGEKGTDIDALINALDNQSEQVSDPVEKAEKQSTSAFDAPSKAETTQKVDAAVSQDHAGGRIIASPLAKKMAEERGISLSLVRGSGENGRIVRRDIESYVPASAQSVSSSNVTSGAESYRDEPVSQMRKTIARRLAESKFSAPHFYLNVEINMDNAIAARKTINDKGASKISFNDMVILATAKALKKHPNVNSSWFGDYIRRNDHVNIGVAVAVEDGLLVPVVRFADTKSMQQIGAEVKEYAQKAKDKKLQPADWEGNTFTISNLGMFGIDSFTAIINPPDSCILAVGGIKEMPVVKNGQLVVGNVMKVTLSCDHRVVDGATGAAFLQTLKAYLEDPILMLA